MKKKMYNQPKSEVTLLQSTVSQCGTTSPTNLPFGGDAIPGSLD